MKTIPFLQSKYLTVVTTPPRIIDLIVIHSAEVKESAQSAEWMMSYCAKNDREASWHYAVDCDSITQSVLEKDVAWQAHGANRNGIGIELCGFSKQTFQDWMDDYSRRTIFHAAGLVNDISHRLNIPIEFVDSKGMLAGRRGITTHAEVCKAYPVPDPHFDPGPNFPMDYLLNSVREWKGLIESGIRSWPS